MSETVKPWHALTIEDALQTLGSDAEQGLSAAEAARRIKQYGYNELQERPGTPLWRRILDQLGDFIVLILIGAAVISALLGDWIEAVVIMAIVVLNTTIGVVQESKAEEALEALKKMAAPEARTIRDGRHSTIPSRELVPGDIVVLDAGNIIPADVRLLESINLKVEEASLTGESLPVNKRAALTLPSDAGLGDRQNSAYMSTMVSYGRGTGLVVGTGMGTEIGHIAEMIQSVEEEETPLQRKLNELGKTLGIACLAVCFIVFAVGMGRVLLGATPLEVGETLLDRAVGLFMIAVSLAIAAVPEGLAAVVTICLALGMQEMVKRHALIRRLPAVETLGSATVICSDKTGTLTQNQMTVTRISVMGHEYTVSGGGYNPQGEFLEDGRPVEPRTHRLLNQVLWAGGLCNDALLEALPDKAYRIIGDPTEGALTVAAEKAGYTRTALAEQFPRVAELPFDSDRKRMTTFHDLSAAGKDAEALGLGDAQLIGIVKGAPDIVLEHCTHVQSPTGPVPLTPELYQRIRSANTDMAGQALRVLAMAYRLYPALPEEITPETVETDLVYIGLQGMIDPARPEVLPAIRKARGAGLRTIMITGDYEVTAGAIATEIGVLRPGGRVVSGQELEMTSDADLQVMIEDVDVFARVSPNHKVRIVEALRANGHVVAMTGDGVNDAPSLKRADIGIAMGITGTDVSKQTADMVLTDDNYASIVSAIEQGRIIYSNIRKFVYFLISCNMAEIAIIFIATLLGWPSPLSVIQLLWLNLLSDGAPALALGLEKGDPDLMQRPPRPPKEPVINREMLIGVIVQTCAITFAVLLAYWRGMVHFSVEMGTDPVKTAQSMAFVTLLFSELFRAYTARSERYPLLKLGLFSNKWMQYAVGFSVIMALVVVYVPFFQPIFDTIPLELDEWLEMTPLFLLPSVVAEIHKAILVWWERRNS